MFVLLKVVIFFIVNVLGTAHCANMYPASPSDTPQLVEARHQIQQHIMMWLQADAWKKSATSKTF